jgi:hypothetical protein
MSSFYESGQNGVSKSPDCYPYEGEQSVDQLMSVSFALTKNEWQPNALGTEPRGSNNLPLDEPPSE